MIEIVNLTLTEDLLYFIGQFTILIETNKWLFIYKFTLLYWLLYYIDILLHHDDQVATLELAGIRVIFL